MKVTVLFFGSLRDRFGSGPASVRVQPPLTVKELFLKLTADKGKNWEKLPLRYALNEEFVSADTRLKEGDTVAFLPPMSGG